MIGCFYCNVELRRSGGRRRTREHVVPKASSRYQTLTPEQHGLNVVDCCHRCNSRKGDTDPVAWIDRVPKDWRPRYIERLRALGVPTGLRLSPQQHVAASAYRGSISLDTVEWAKMPDPA